MPYPSSVPFEDKPASSEDLRRWFNHLRESIRMTERGIKGAKSAMENIERLMVKAPERSHEVAPEQG